MRFKYSAARSAGESLISTLTIISSLPTVEQLAICLERNVFFGPFLKQSRVAPKLEQCGSNLLRLGHVLERGIKARFLVPPFGIAAVSHPPDESIAHLESSRSDIHEIAVPFLRGTGESNHTEKGEDRKSTRLNSSHSGESRMPSSA